MPDFSGLRGRVPVRGGCSNGCSHRWVRRSAVRLLPVLLAGCVILLAPGAQAAQATRPAEAALPVDAEQESELLRLAGKGFQIKRTPHFVVAFNTNPALCDELAGRLEDTYRSVYRFVDSVGIDAHRLPRRLEVLFFNRRGEYDRYGAELSFKSQGTYGVYYEPTNRSAFFNVYNEPQLLKLLSDIGSARRTLGDLKKTLNGIKGNGPIIVTYGDGRRETLSKVQVRKRIETAERDLKILDGRRANYSERINRTVVQHEAAHQVLFNAGVHIRRGANPKWLVEGLACLFETPPGEAGAGIAAINQLRLKDFRSAAAGTSEKRVLSASDFIQALSAGRMFPAGRLVSDPRVFDEREQLGATAYAQTWSLTHYLQRRHPRRLAAYLREIAARKVGEPVTPERELVLFEKHFGKLDDAFLRQWGGYTLQLSYRAPVGF